MRITPASARKFALVNPIQPAGSLQLREAKSQEKIPEKTMATISVRSRRRSAANLRISEDKKQAIAEELQKTPLYASSIEEQTEKTGKLYTHYCEQTGVESPFPITREVGEPFLVWLRQTNHFTARSIRTVVLNALPRLNMMHKNALIDPFTMAVLKQRVRTFYRMPSTKKPRGGVEAIIPDDVYRMISVMDERDPLTSSIGSLLIFGLATGSRGSTIKAITVADILYYQVHPQDGSSQVTIRLTHLKAHPTESRELSLSGFINRKWALDFVYLLNLHLLDLTGLPLPTLAGNTQLPEVIKRRKLWDYSSDSMTLMIKRRMSWAGLPSAKIGVHSLRHGFLTTAHVVQAQRGNGSLNVMTDASVFAVWEANSKTLFGYIDEATRRSTPVTNFTGLTSTPVKTREASFVPEGESSPHYNSLDFHRCSLSCDPSLYNAQHSYGLAQVRMEMRELLHLDGSNSAHKQYLRVQWAWLLRLTARIANQEAEKDELKKQKLDEVIASEGGLSPTLSKQVRLKDLGALLLDHHLKGIDNAYKHVAEKLYQKLQDASRIPPSLPTSTESTSQSISLDKVTRSNGLTVRKRIDWSIKEDRIFIRCLRLRYTLEQCAAQLPLRTPTQISDHLVAFNKQRRKREKPHVSFKRKNYKPQDSVEELTDMQISTSELIDSDEIDPEGEEEEEMEKLDDDEDQEVEDEEELLENEAVIPSEENTTSETTSEDSLSDDIINMDAVPSLHHFPPSNPPVAVIQSHLPSPSQTAPSSPSSALIDEDIINIDALISKPPQDQPIIPLTPSEAEVSSSPSAILQSSLPVSYPPSPPCAGSTPPSYDPSAHPPSLPPPPLPPIDLTSTPPPSVDPPPSSSLHSAQSSICPSINPELAGAFSPLQTPPMCRVLPLVPFYPSHPFFSLPPIQSSSTTYHRSSHRHSRTKHPKGRERSPSRSITPVKKQKHSSKRRHDSRHSNSYSSSSSSTDSHHYHHHHSHSYHYHHHPHHHHYHSRSRSTSSTTTDTSKQVKNKK